MCIQCTRELCSVVITRQSTPPISQFNSPYKETTSFLSIFVNNICFPIVKKYTSPSTGTHWSYEVISMIRQKAAKRVQTNKFLTMLEAQTADVVNAQASPRVLNCHYSPRHALSYTFVKYLLVTQTS